MCAALALVSLAVLRNSNTPDESVQLLADSRVDFSARLSSARASRSSKPRAVIAPATTIATTIPPPPPTTAKPKPKPVYKASTVTTAKPKPKPAPKPAASATMHSNTPTTVSARPMPAAGGSASAEEGRASWYDAKYHEANPWICAHKTIAKGIVLTVTNVNTGASITCEVGDRGPYVDGRILDLSKYAFSRLANPSTGLIWVKITW